MTPRGKFIVIDGIDRVGKSTNVPILAAWITEQYGISVVTCRDPGTDSVAEELRQIALQADGDLSPMALAFLFCAARAQLSDKVILPNLEAGNWVICDRFVDSTFAYQVAPMAATTHATTLERLADAIALSARDLIADLTIILDAPPSRLQGRHSHDDRFERPRDMQAIRETFCHRAAQNDRYHVVNADDSVESISKHLQQLISQNLMRV